MGTVDASFALSRSVIGAAIEVHQELGPGSLESAYEVALCIELQRRGVDYERQVRIPARYMGTLLDVAFVADLVVERSLLLELKSVRAIEPVHVSQVLTHLKLIELRRGLIINFFSRRLKDGIKRVSL